MGFSAGGNLAAKASTLFDKRSYAAIDAVDRQGCRPDFAVLVYPAYLADKDGKVSGDLDLTAKIPPTLIVHSEDDKPHVPGSKAYHAALKEAKAPHEFKLALTLIQAMRHESVASGLVQVALAGLTANRPSRYTLGELLGRPRAQLPFSFRYFQTIEQNVTLPADFEPLEVEIEVRSSKLKSPVRQTFPWKSTAPPPL